MSEEIYSLKNVPLFEAMYGKGLISLGGYDAIDDMFKGVELNGKKILDIGSGIGGMAHYLSIAHGAYVTGLEVHPWMAQYAADNAPSEIKSKVSFICYNDDGGIPIPSKSLDIVCSKGVLTNVENKKGLFSEVFRVLKTSGEICLMDWLVPEERGPKYERLSLGDMSFKETQSSYHAILKDCGFRNISFKNKSAEYLEYVRSLISLLDSDEHRKDFSDVVDPVFRKDLIQAELKLQTLIEQKEQFSILIQANV